jgi:zinc D-Ala-D-Ala carboxypeptidase
MSWNHFTEEEFTCNCGCGVNEIKSDLIDRLEAVRKLHGMPMHINSGYRCKVSNDNAGSSDTSSHLLGEAADISCTNSKDRFALVRHLGTQFHRIGIHKQFLHVDISHDKKTSPALWVY